MSDGVLIVDDSLTVRMDLAEAFRSAGFEPIPCETAAQARAVLSARAVAVVILDLLLPDADGLDLLRELRAASATATLPVLLLSTEAEVRDRALGLATGADEYVGKPYEASHVVARARALVRRRHEAPQRGPTVLVIDDSLTFREALREALEAAGYRVLTAASGEEGLRIAADARPGAVIVDGVLPGADGTTVIRRLRLDAALRRTPCLLLTASEEEGAELRALDAGADAFVRKEEDVALILARLAAILRNAGDGEERAAGSLLSPKRLLAVDDSAPFLKALSATLQQEGYEVILAHSGEEALELLAVQQVDCILLDLLMPGLSGEETCRRIKATPGTRDIPLIMLTAVEERASLIAGLGAGADDCVGKAGDVQVLKARVLAQLRRRQFEDENRRYREQQLRGELDAAEARAARELAETRAALVEQLERKNRELEAFSYSVSHDLRAPLRSIDGFSRALLEHHSGSLPPEGQAYLQRVRAAAQRMDELIDDLLELSRVGRVELRVSPVQLSGLALLVAAKLQEAHPARPVTVRVEEGLMAHADPRLLRLALENLLGNAWKFTGHAAAPVIEVGSLGAGSGTEPGYFVRDNGVGFDQAHAGKLFAPFQRLHPEAEFPGTGIGLATVQRVIDLHGGRIWAEARVGAGATFCFTLPREAKGGKG